MEKAIRRYWPVFVLPTLIAFIIGFVWPFIWGAGLSFCKFTTVNNVQFVGLSNYAMIWSDNTFTHAFWFTAAFTVVSTLLVNVLAFAIALLLTRGMHGTNAFRTIFFLPNLIGGSIEMIGNATTPLTMFCIGFQIGGLKFKEIAGDFQVYAICFVKLLIVPVLTLLVVKLWAGDFSMLEKVLIIGFAMPVGAVASIFSQQYKGEAAFATKSVLLSTVLSLITIPIFAIIMEL